MAGSKWYSLDLTGHQGKFLKVDSSEDLIVFEGIQGGGGPSTNSIVDILYSDLITLMGSVGGMSPGQLYRITNYKTVHALPVYAWNSNSQQFDYNINNSTMATAAGETVDMESLIVFAVTERMLGKKAWSETYPYDEIEYDCGYVFDLAGVSALSNISKDPAFYQFSASTYVTGFTGAITYRKDTIDNIECDYDWRNVWYRRFLYPVGIKFYQEDSGNNTLSTYPILRIDNVNANDSNNIGASPNTEYFRTINGSFPSDISVRSFRINSRDSRLTNNVLNGNHIKNVKLDCGCSCNTIGYNKLSSIGPRNVIINTSYEYDGNANFRNNYVAIYYQGCEDVTCNFSTQTCRMVDTMFSDLRNVKIESAALTQIKSYLWNQAYPFYFSEMTSYSQNVRHYRIGWINFIAYYEVGQGVDGGGNVISVINEVQWIGPDCGQY